MFNVNTMVLLYMLKHIFVFLFTHEPQLTQIWRPFTQEEEEIQAQKCCKY